ncbi:hypothetical protein LL14B4_04860 [Lactococcus lactis subsp. lactis]|uniref:Uncharacterized protein n=1 Tax=Lactococcus lactis subsp. lactis TaxID=1360 RepID=A0A2Z3KNA9_LACLL|nr:hypothetical protein [Lactococcus lactis]AWN65539.1 hypothetical protein LL14B4_04860 [Lactococcus lactis subsp. lactis]
MIDLGKFFEKVADNHLITTFVAIILTGFGYLLFPRNPKSEINILIYLVFLFAIAFIFVTVIAWVFNKARTNLNNRTYRKSDEIRLEQRYKEDDLKFISDNNVFDEVQKDFILNQLLNENEKKSYYNSATPLDRFDNYDGNRRFKTFVVTTPKNGGEVYMKLGDRVFKYLNYILLNYEKFTDFDTADDSPTVKAIVDSLKKNN